MDFDSLMEACEKYSPFPLIDKIVSVKEGESITAVKNVSLAEPFFLGHFPKCAIMPGILIIDSFIQAGTLLLGEENRLKMRIKSVNKFRFIEKISPGDQVLLDLEIVSHDGEQIQMSASASVNNKAVATGELSFASVK